ncbi:hypothetical protein Tco_0985084 [Tanacetum coccineum]
MLYNSKQIQFGSPGEKDGEMYYGRLEEILKFLYKSFKVVLFRVKWFDTSNEGRKLKCFVIRNNITQILASSESFKDQQYILATQVKQVFYLKDMARRPLHWKLVQDLNDLDFVTLNKDGQSTEVKAPPNIIVVDDNDDFINDEDGMQAAVACGHGGDSGCDDPSRPFSRQIGIGCRGVGGRKATRKGMGGGRDRGT